MYKTGTSQTSKTDSINQDSKRYFYEYSRLNKSRKITRRINQLLSYIKNEKTFYEKICDILVKKEDYKLTYICILDEELNKPVFFTDTSDRDNFILGNNKISNEDNNINLPEAISMKSQQIYLLNDLEKDSVHSIWRQEAINRGYRSVIALPIKIRNKIVGSLTIFSDMKDLFDREEISFLKEVTDDISIGVRSFRSEEELKRNYERYRRALYETVDAIALISERRDPYTGGHQRKVALLSSAIAKELRLSDYDIEGIYLTGLLHDIGKISIPLSILSKPSRLNNPETMIIKLHPQDAYEILKAIEFPWPVAQTVLQHHERLDGSGYPNGLKGDEIILNARILGVADVVEAMSSHRPYRPAVGLNKALKEILRNKRLLFDPKVVDACLKVFNEKKFEF